MDGRRRWSNRRQVVAERERRTRGAVSHPVVAAPTDRTAWAEADRVVTLPDTDAHRAVTAAVERLARARDAARDAAESRRRVAQLVEEQQSRLRVVRTSPATAPALDRAAAPTPALDEPDARAPDLRAPDRTTPTLRQADRTTSDHPTPDRHPPGSAQPDPRPPALPEPAAHRPVPPMPATLPRQPARPNPAPRPVAAQPLAPTGEPTTGERPRRRVPLLLLLLIIVVAVVVLGLVRQAGDSPGANPAVSPETTAGGVPTGGDLTVFAQIEGEDVQVREVTRWGAERPDEVTLRLPELGSLTGEAGAAQLEVSDLVVTVDGAPVVPEQDPAAPGSWRVPLDEGADPQAMEVSYRLTGALVISDQSSPGRQLAILGPLSSQAATGAAAVTIRGSGILGVYCPGLPAEQLLCATRSGDDWDAALPDPSATVVLVQIDRT